MPDYYSFRVGRWQVLSLNSEARHDAGSAQIRWLERRLRRGSRFGDCRIAFWHRPLHSAAHGHGDQPDVAPLWDALAGHARLVLNGHDHTLQRLRPSDGITELIAGAGGRPPHPIDRSDPRPLFADDTSAGALRIRLRGEVARIAFLAAGGGRLDRSRTRCRRG